MKTFNVKSLFGWEKLEGSGRVGFDNHGQSRSIAFTVNAEDKVFVYASFNEDMSDKVLLAASDGMFEVGFSTAIPVYVEFISETGQAVYWRGPAASHVVPKVEEPAYTTVEPKGRRNSDVDRMMFYMRLNEQRRDQQLATTIAELKAAAARPAEPKVTEPKVEVVENAAESAGDAAE